MSAVGDRDVQLPRQLQLRHVAPSTAGGTDADQIDRAMADVVIAVAAEILGRELPVARHKPFLDAAQNLGAAVAAVPAVERLVEISGEIAEIILERRRRLVPGGPDRALVNAHLRDLDEAPLGTVELGMIGLAEER